MIQVVVERRRIVKSFHLFEVDTDDRDEAHDQALDSMRNEILGKTIDVSMPEYEHEVQSIFGGKVNILV
jgi:hypothetical protein